MSSLLDQRSLGGGRCLVRDGHFLDVDSTTLSRPMRVRSFEVRGVRAASAEFQYPSLSCFCYVTQITRISFENQIERILDYNE